MGKEVKIGLVVMGVLLCVFGGVLLLRLRPQKTAFAAQSKSAGAKQPAKKADKKTKAKIAAGKRPPAFGAPPREPSGDAPETADPFAVGNAASDDVSGDLTDERQNAWSDRYANAPEAEPGADEVPDVADSPYGGRYRRNAVEPATGREAEDTPQYAASEAAEDEVFTNAGHGGRGYLLGSEDDGVSGQGSEEYRDTVSNEFDRYGHDDAGAVMSDEVAAPEDRFADGGVAAPNWTDQEEVVADDEAAQPRLGFDRYRERSDYQLPPLETTDPEVRPAVGSAIAGEDISPDDLPGAGDDAAASHATADRFAVEPAPPRRLADAADGVYVVEANDNFWIISQKLYGTGAYFKALQEHNRPRPGGAAALNVGDEISAPPLEVLRESYPELCPKAPSPAPGRPARAGSGHARSARLYTVAEGDTLFDIARHQLGKASRWLEIYELNRDQLGGDFNYLAAGMQLQLPGDAPEPIANRPRRDAYLR